MTRPEIKTTESSRIWKQKLDGKIPSEFDRHIEDYEKDIFLKHQGKIEDKLFAETRLRMGAYGQRYDNGRRHDGNQDRAIPYPDDQTKGPGTMWHAPGMQRIKLPFGGLNPEQMEAFADLAEEYSDSISHITTRQDIQLHYVHIEDTPSMYRRLAAVGITTREACGNSVRNVTACPFSGTCKDESFDVTPYAHACFRYLLGHPDVQDFGRKFKIALSGCKHNPCALTYIHDLGLIAVSKEVDGALKRGFEMYVGGGLGAVPYQAKLLQEFVPEEELLPMTQAICRVYARLGEKKKRHRARIKFLVADMGIEKFTEAVLEERKRIPTDEKWTEFLSNLNAFDETPKKKGAPLPQPNGDAGFVDWLQTNIRHQKQDGYFVVTVSCPLGDITSNQMRMLADISRKYTNGTARTTVEQNLVLRWVSGADIKDLYLDLKKVGLSESGAGTILDITACPGTDTCKLGVASSRGLAAEIRKQLAETSVKMDSAVRDLRIKISGCFNSCGQQHVSDIGFYGIGRNVSGYVVPHFQMVLGGQFQSNGENYGLPVGGIPSKAIPNALGKLTSFYLEGREKGEEFRAFVERVGKRSIMEALKDHIQVPAYEKDKSFYMDWADVREFSVRDKGMGECAGEVVSLTDFGLKAADRENFESQILLEEGKFQEAAAMAYKSMASAAQGLIKRFNVDISEDPEQIMKEFRERYYDTELFYDPYAGPKFAQYYFKAHEDRKKSADKELATRLIHEAGLFIEASHSCNLRLSMQAAEAPKK